MCLCTYHHYPCGHIASFTFESCTDITNFLRANIHPLSHRKIKKLDLLNEKRPHRFFKCERNLRDASSVNSNQPSLTSDSKYIPLEGDTANFPIISNAMVIQSMRRSGYCSGWDADISGSDARPASFKSRVGKTCRLGRRRKHSGGNAHNHSSVVPHNVSGLDSRITTRYKDIAAATEEDPGYEAEDDERGRTTLKSRRYSPVSLGRIYELPGSFPEPDESAYDTAPEDTASPSEEGSSDLSHERLLTAMEAGIINASYEPFRRMSLQAHASHHSRKECKSFCFEKQNCCRFALANLRLTEATRDDTTSHSCL